MGGLRPVRKTPPTGNTPDLIRCITGRFLGNWLLRGVFHRSALGRWPITLLSQTDDGAYDEQGQRMNKAYPINMMQIPNPNGLPTQVLGPERTESRFSPWPDVRCSSPVKRCLCGGAQRSAAHGRELMTVAASIPGSQFLEPNLYA